MAKSETAIRDRSKGIRLAFWLLIGFLGLVTAAVFALFCLSVYVNTSGAIPDQLRDDPPEIAAFGKQAPSVNPPPMSQSYDAMAQKRTELSSRDEDFKFVLEIEALNNEFGRTFEHRLGNELSPTGETWIRNHASQLKQINEYIQNSNPNKEDALFAFTQFGHGVNRFWLWTNFLNRGAQFHMKQRDFPNANKCFQSAIKLNEMVLRRDTRYYAMNIFHVTSLYLLKAIEDPGWPSDQSADLVRALEDLDIKLFDIGALRRELVADYLRQRRALVLRLDGAWYDPIFGMPSDDSDFYYKTNYYIFGDQIELPKIGKYLETTHRAMSNKRRSAACLKLYDAEKQRVLKRFELSFTKRLATLKEAEAESQHYTGNCFFPVNLTSSELAAVVFHQYESTMHLARVGILYRIDPVKALAVLKKNMNGEPHNPWRDPFTEEPLHIEELTTQTLIYSIGPTLKPDNGRRSLNTHVHVPKK